MTEDEYNEDKDLVSRIVKYELDELTPHETLDLFCELTKSGQVWQLQGAYGRQAAAYIRSGWMTQNGDITAAGKLL